MLLNKVETRLGILIFYMCKEKNNTLNLAFKYKVIWLFFEIVEIQDSRIIHPMRIIVTFVNLFFTFNDKKSTFLDNNRCIASVSTNHYT